MRRLASFGVVVVALLAVTVILFVRGGESSPSTPGGEARGANKGDRAIVLAAVGDTNPPKQKDPSTSAGQIASSIRAANPLAVLHLGDVQYEYGKCWHLVNYFDRTGWGELMPKLIGTAGPTHDWTGHRDRDNYRRHMAGTCPGQTSGKSLSSKAWGSNVGPETSHYVDLGAWRVYSVSSGLWRYEPAAASRVTEWLDLELAKGRAVGDHAVVMWHEPYWTSVTEGHDEATDTEPWLHLLDKYDVKISLHGHQHGYERFEPQNADGTEDSANGTQSFTVGSGGIGFYDFENRAHHSSARQAHTYGWLQLTLRPDGHYDWRFVSTGGGTYSDSGSR
jgi:hypothetical protein